MPLHAPRYGKHQTFFSCRVINNTAFGRAFRKRLRSSTVQRLLPDYGLMDGGCLSLALAVQNCLGKHACDIVFVVAGGIPQHAAVRVILDDKYAYLDADGLASKKDLLFKMRTVELTPADAFITPVSVEYAAKYGIADNDLLSESLTKVLRPFFAHNPIANA